MTRFAPRVIPGNWTAAISTTVLLVIFAGWLLHVDQVFVDLNSGRIAMKSMTCGVYWRSRIVETRFSLLCDVQPTTRENWQLASEVGPLQPISPHFRIHGIPSLLIETALVCETDNRGLAASRRLCRELLRLLGKNEIDKARELVSDPDKRKQAAR